MGVFDRLQHDTDLPASANQRSRGEASPRSTKEVGRAIRRLGEPAIPGLLRRSLTPELPADEKDETMTRLQPLHAGKWSGLRAAIPTAHRGSAATFPRKQARRKLPWARTLTDCCACTFSSQLSVAHDLENPLALC